MKPFYVVIFKGPRVGFSFVLKSNAISYAKRHGAIGIIKTNSVNSIRFDKMGPSQEEKALTFTTRYGHYFKPGELKGV